GEIRVDDEAGLLLHRRPMPRRRQLLAERRRAPVLPHDRVVHGLAAAALPHHRRLALVGDADRRHVRRRCVRLVQHTLHDRHGRAPDLLGVVLDPAVGRIDLRQLLLRRRLRLAVGVEQDRPRARRALVDRQDEAPFRHDPPPFLRFRMIGAGLPRCQPPKFFRSRTPPRRYYLPPWPRIRASSRSSISCASAASCRSRRWPTTSRSRHRRSAATSTSSPTASCCSATTAAPACPRASRTSPTRRARSKSSRGSAASPSSWHATFPTTPRSSSTSAPPPRRWPRRSSTTA